MNAMQKAATRKAEACHIPAECGRRIIIDALVPCVDCGRYAAKRIVGEPCTVEADIFRDGPNLLRAALKWKRKEDRRYSESMMEHLGNDRWRSGFPLEENGRYQFTVEAWDDPFATWVEEFRRKVEGGQTSLSGEMAEGLTLIEKALKRARGDSRKMLLDCAERLRAAAEGDPVAALDVVTDPDLGGVAAEALGRVDAYEYAPALEVVADRPLASFGAWYEMFPRSQGTVPGVHATFRDAERRLQDIKDMGFDVVYLPPIHPIGHTNRKGPNNRLSTDAGDPGSPWAIGSERGGHTSIEPALGTIEDFERFVKVAAGLGLEVALDFAPQCSPDHPWVREHPEWFSYRPDGTIKYAENPPKKYEDVLPLSFNTVDKAGLWTALRDVLLFWIEHGVRVFRVDNPHTKPLEFWRWLIEDVQSGHPDVIFLSEAFTRPKMMKALAKSGFTQSYTYFTWRNSKQEFVDYLTELTRSGMEDYFRPNFFTNTPDILSEVLRRGGRAAFKMRLVLAATLSPSYGIYSGFELCENEGIPGTEEYKDSEKYEIKVRDWDMPGNIKDFIAKINGIRRANAALRELTNLEFFDSDSDQILVYGKATGDKSNVVIVAVNLDPFSSHYCMARVPLEEIGVKPGGRYVVRDLLTGAEYEWGERNYIRLTPDTQPAHILRLERRI
jgi:starch synthase (maltosyl-transferring)